MNKYHKDGTLPENGEVFVFGSNLAGIHGAGAAKIACSNFGAVYGDNESWMRGERAYAIPTKDYHLKTLDLTTIGQYINKFVRMTNNDFILNNGYFVTRVGCGLAGYTDAQIAPMFKGARNCSFAEEWKEYLE